MHYLQVARLISEAISEANLSQVRLCCLLAAVLMNQSFSCGLRCVGRAHEDGRNQQCEETGPCEMSFMLLNAA